MKKMMMTLAAVLCYTMTMLTACNNESSKMENLLIGKWTLVSFDDNTQAEGVGSEWEYQSDKTFKYSMQGQTISGTYTINGNDITMTAQDTPWTVTVKEITPSQMTWEGPKTGKDVVLKKQE